MNNFILCKPNRKTLCVLNGVQLDSVSYTPKLNDLDEITFIVDKYIVDDDGNEIVSQGYEQLHAFMEVYLDGIGYFQIKEPQISNDGDRETKTVTGVSTDCELLQKDLVGFTVNKTTANSLEMLADNNVNSLGYPNEYITFYNPSNPQLSLMDLVLEKAVGWKVGFIDDFLKNLRFVFDNVNENILSFSTKTLSSTARCIFDFDTVNKTVSAYAENHIGKDTGIIIAYRNLLNKVDISCDSDNIFTRLNVQGKDSLTFADINYGDTHVFNLDYYKNTNYMDDELIAKLDIWEQARNDNREDYISKVKTYHDYVEQISVIDNKVPTNGVLNNWDNMSMDELTKNQTYYNSLIKSFQITAQNTHPQGSETIYTGNLDDYSPSRLNPDGTVDHEAYMADLDGQGKETYREIITYVLPNIQIAIDNFDKPATKKSDYLTDYLTEWDLYGIVELKAKQSSYEEQLNTLKDYAKNWSDLTDEEKTSHGNNQANYELYHNEYTKIDGYLTAIASKLTELDTQKQSLLASRDAVQAELKQIRNDMAITGGRVVDGIYTNWFTNDEIELINLLFHDTDYTNENILITSLDDFNKQIEIEQELYDDAVAQLEELSVPQYSFSCELDNLLDIEEFKEWKEDFKIGNFITLEVSPNCFTKLRLVSITYNPCIKSNDLTVEFSNMVTTKSGRNDFSYIFDKAISVAKNSITYSNNQNKDSIELSTELLNLLSGSSVFQGKFDNLGLKNISANEAQIVKLTADYVKVKELDAKYATIDFANITEAAIDKLKTTSLFADYIKADEIEANYLKTNFANIDNANIDIANIGILFNKVGLIDRATIVDGHITGYLDAVEINANNITAGTLIADRILLKAPEGLESNGLLYAINNLGELSSTSVDTIDGYVLTDRTINADKIIASSITTKELDVNEIFANTAVITKLTAQDAFIEAISTNSIVVDASNKINNLEIGGVNFLLNTKFFATASSTSLRGAFLSGLPISDGDYYRGFAIRGNTITASTTEICKYNFTDFSLGDTFTFSFYAKGDVTELRAFFYGASGYVQVAKSVNCQGETSTNIDGRLSFYITSDWQRYWITWTLKDTGDISVPKYVMLRTNNAVSGQTVYVCGCKLESGNKMTTWTPAVEDTETAISDASIVNWCYENDKTIIDGGKVATGTITAKQIATDAIKSTNYIAEASGSFLNLADGSFDSKYLKWDETGVLTATSGTIAGWEFNSGYLCKKLKSGDTEEDNRYVYINTELSTNSSDGTQYDTPKGRIIGINTSLEGRKNQISATSGALYINADGSVYSADSSSSFNLESGRLYLTNVITGGTVADGEYMCSVDGGTLQFCKLSDGKQPKTGFLYLGEMGNHLAGILGIRGIKGLCSDVEDINIITGGNLILKATNALGNDDGNITISGTNIDLIGTSITAKCSITGDLNGTATSANKVNNSLTVNGESFDGSIAKNINLLPFISGTQTSSTGLWTGIASTISVLFDGLTIRYWLPYAGSGNASLSLTLADGTSTGDIPCYYGGTTRLTTHYGAGNIITLTYRENIQIGTTVIDKGWWADANYNSNTLNTAGATDTSSKIFLIGSTSQSASSQTYSNKNVYVDTSGKIIGVCQNVTAGSITNVAAGNSSGKTISLPANRTKAIIDVWVGASTRQTEYVTGLSDSMTAKASINLLGSNTTYYVSYSVSNTGVITITLTNNQSSGSSQIYSVKYVVTYFN